MKKCINKKVIRKTKSFKIASRCLYVVIAHRLTTIRPGYFLTDAYIMHSTFAKPNHVNTVIRIFCILNQFLVVNKTA